MIIIVFYNNIIQKLSVTGGMMCLVILSYHINSI